MSVRPSVRMEQLDSKRKKHHEVWYLIIFPKSAEKIQIPLKYDEHDVYFTWKPIMLLNTSR